MKNKMINELKIQGRVQQHKLEKKVSAKGANYIRGTITIATDDNMVNLIPYKVIYAGEKTAKGETSPTYRVLSDLIEKDNTILKVGKDQAAMIKVDTSVALNDWYSKDQQTGEYKLISTQEASGGFVNSIAKLDADEGARCKFMCDIVINNIVHIEEDEDAGVAEKVTVNGVIFNYKKEAKPVNFIVTNPMGIKYFSNLDDVTPNTPMFTKVWGKFDNVVTVTKTTEESGFGEPVVTERRSEKKEWVITGIIKEALEFDAEETILASEYKKCAADRNIFLSELLAGQIQRDEDKAKNNASQASTETVATGGFDF